MCNLNDSNIFLIFTCMYKKVTLKHNVTTHFLQEIKDLKIALFCKKKKNYAKIFEEMRKEEHGRSVISTYIPGHFRLRVGGSAANFCIRLACRKVGKIRGENGKTETRFTISCIPFALLAPSSSPCPLSFPPTSFHPFP